MQDKIIYNNYDMEANLYNKTSGYQAHPYHLVSPSPWPIVTSIGLLTLTTSGVLSMHNFVNGEKIFFAGLVTVIYAMSLWFRDVISEGTYIGNHTLAVQKGINLGIALFIISEVMFLSLNAWISGWARRYFSTFVSFPSGFLESSFWSAASLLSCSLDMESTIPYNCFH